MSNVFDMNAYSIEVGDEVDIPCKVVALHQFEDGRDRVTVKTRHPRSGTKNEYSIFELDARQIVRTSRPGQLKLGPKLCKKCKRHPSACVCPVSDGEI